MSVVSVKIKTPAITIPKIKTNNQIEQKVKADVQVVKGENTTLSFKNIYEFPNRGNAQCVYIAENENSLYRWSEEETKYFCIGRDYKNITIINGGNA